MRPEMPYLAAGATAVVGGVARDGRFPSEGFNAVIATVVLVIVASMTSGTRIAPLVRAIGLLLFMAAVMAAVTSINNSHKTKDK